MKLTRWKMACALSTVMGVVLGGAAINSAAPQMAAPPTSTAAPTPPTATHTSQTGPAQDAFDRLPPLTVSFNKVDLSGVVAALRSSLQKPSWLQHSPGRPPIIVLSGPPLPPTPPPGSFSIAAKNMPFWEIIRSLQAQGPIGFPDYGIINNSPGLTLLPQRAVHHFQTNGPAILFPYSITYERRSGRGSARIPPSGFYQLTLEAAVDPRILVAKCMPIELMEITDDSGRNIPVPEGPTDFESHVPSNFWITIVTLPPVAPAVRHVNVKCRVRFSAQLATGMVTLDDATNKVGMPITLGEHQLRLARCDVRGNLINFQLDAGGGRPATLLNANANPLLRATLFDATGRTMLILPPGNSPISISPPSPVTPFQLLICDPSAVRDLSYTFELKDILLP